MEFKNNAILCGRIQIGMHRQSYNLARDFLRNGHAIAGDWIMTIRDLVV